MGVAVGARIACIVLMFRAPSKLLLLACAAFAACATTTTTGPATLRVLTYNIHHGAGSDGILDLPRIAAVISTANPDIVCLQEVDRRTIRAGGVDQAIELAYLLDMEAHFHRCIDVQGGEYGLAILSRLHVRAVHHLTLPGDRETRGLIGVVVAPANDPVLVCSTHFDHGRDNPSRLEAARVVAEFATQSPFPTILAGDLNAYPSSAVITLLDETFTIPNHPAPTFPANLPQRRIDYILHTHYPNWHLTETSVLPEPLASDHRPVLAVFQR